MKITDAISVIAVGAVAALVVSQWIAPQFEKAPDAGAEATVTHTGETAPARDGGLMANALTNAAVLKKETDGHFWANADVGGTQVKFMVDTGASTVALTYGDAQRIGLAPDTLDYRWRIRTAGGEVLGASVLLPSVRIGQVEVENVEAMVLRDGLTQSLLGMSFLSELRSYEFRQRNLILRQ